MTTAIYAGSFDPPTYGHRWMIQEALEIFDSLIIAVGRNPAKKSMFSVAERQDMLRGIALDLDVYNKCEIVSCDGLLVNFAYEHGATHIIRGVRSGQDFEYERGMANINTDIQPNITTVFLTPPRELAEVSSSMVKDLVGFPGWESVVEKYVTPQVLYQLRQKADR